MYSSPEKTYRDIIKEQGLEHSSKTNEETQITILDWMTQQQELYPKGSKVIYDRCPLDNLVYTLQGNLRGLISDDIAAVTIPIVRESMRNLDIIFWLKYNPAIKIVDDGLRDSDLEYIKETDQIFSEVFQDHMDNLDNDIFFPKDDCPAIIALDDMFPTVDDRMMFIGEFLDTNGDLIETAESVLSPESLELFERMMTEQEKQKEADDRLNEIIKSLKA